MEEFEVKLSEQFQRMADFAALNTLLALIPEDNRKAVSVFCRAFLKRGVPLSTIIDVFREIENESGES